MTTLSESVEVVPAPRSPGVATTAEASLSSSDSHRSTTFSTTTTVANGAFSYFARSANADAVVCASGDCRRRGAAGAPFDDHDDDATVQSVVSATAATLGSAVAAQAHTDGGSCLAAAVTRGLHDGSLALQLHRGGSEGGTYMVVPVPQAPRGSSSLAQCGLSSGDETTSPGSQRSLAAAEAAAAAPPPRRPNSRLPRPLGARPQQQLPPHAPPPAPLAVFKPAEEEIGQELNPHGNSESGRADEFPPGTGYLREVLAFELDRRAPAGLEAGVPETVEATINGRVGSLQRFVRGCVEAGNVMPRQFSSDAVHRLAVFDLRVLNGDRHGGNILVERGSRVNEPPRLVPIDHSYILPSGYAEPDFEWKEWPQSKEPFAPALLAAIAALDADADAAVVRDALGGDEDAADMVAVMTRVLQHGARCGYTARQLAEFCRRETLTQPAQLELLIGRARRSLDEGGNIDMAAVEAQLRDMLPAQ